MNVIGRLAYMVLGAAIALSVVTAHLIYTESATLTPAEHAAFDKFYTGPFGPLV